MVDTSNKVSFLDVNGDINAGWHIIKSFIKLFDHATNSYIYIPISWI